MQGLSSERCFEATGIEIALNTPRPRLFTRAVFPRRCPQGVAGRSGGTLRAGVSPSGFLWLQVDLRSRCLGTMKTCLLPRVALCLLLGALAGEPHHAPLCSSSWHWGGWRGSTPGAPP